MYNFSMEMADKEPTWTQVLKCIFPLNIQGSLVPWKMAIFLKLLGKNISLKVLKSRLAML